MPLKVTEAINAQSSESSLMAQYVDALKSNLGNDRLVLYAADLDGQTWKLLVSRGYRGDVANISTSIVFREAGFGQHRLGRSDGGR